MNYTYDPLKRLAAAATVGPQWGQAYTYDGFGNLAAQTVTQGSGVNWANASNAANNRMIGLNYDANGNWDMGTPWVTSYDEENRLTAGPVNHPGCQGQVGNWTYDPSGKRIIAFDPCIAEQYPDNSPNYPTGYYRDISFYDIFGKRIVTYACTPAANDPAGNGYCLYLHKTYVYFGNRLISAEGTTVVTDRLGTVRANSSGERFSFLPYGEEQTSTSDFRMKFATYFRDSTGTTSQDYADQRYYNFWYGRFSTPDPSSQGNPADPASWNKYSYVQGDPINNHDPFGLFLCNPDFCTSDPPVWYVPAGGGAGGGGGWPAKITIEPPSWQDEWDNLSSDCQKGLQTKFGQNANVGVMVKAVNRAMAAESTLTAAAEAEGIDWKLLAGIGLMETAFTSQWQKDAQGNDMIGHGAGVFQIDLSKNPTVGQEAAFTLSWAADWVASILKSNYNYLRANFPNFDPTHLLQATAASWNIGLGNISGDPNTIDVGTKPRGDYGSTVMKLMDCLN